MPVCPACNLQTTGPYVFFCAHCGFALPDALGASEEGSSTADQGLPTGEQRLVTGEEPLLTSEDIAPPAPESLPSGEESSPTLATGETSLALDTVATRPWAARAASSQPDPRAVAVGLAALVVGAVLSILLVYVPGSKPSASVARRSPASFAAHSPVSQPRPHAKATRPPLVSVKRYSAGDYSFAYPSAWHVQESERPVTSYRETVVARADGSARVAIDYTPGETTEPAVKALQVQAPTSTSSGYHQIAFAPTSVRGRPAFFWEFEVADARPRRVDLFLRTRSGGFAILADGRELEGAISAARLIAGSLSGVR